jgi:hypothetical protein
MRLIAPPGSGGLAEQQIKDEILHARDLSKKAARGGNSIMQSEPRSRPSPACSRSAECARFCCGRRGENPSPHGARMPAVPALPRVMRCAVAPPQAPSPAGRFALSRLQAAHPADRDRNACDLSDHPDRARTVTFRIEHPQIRGVTCASNVPLAGFSYGASRVKVPP